jgi:hypothetical protein
MRSTKFIDQLRRNRVALISLVSIEVLLKLADLQQLVWHNHYDGDTEEKGNLRTGWAIVLTIKDIATILDSRMPESAEKLWAVWNDNNLQLGDSTAAKDNIIMAIEKCRLDTLAVLQALN